MWWVGTIWQSTAWDTFSHAAFRSGQTSPENEETILISVSIHGVAGPWSPSEDSWSPTLYQVSLKLAAREIPDLCSSRPLLFPCSIPLQESTLFIHASVDASFGGFQVFLWWSQPCEYSWAHLIVYISFYICWVNSQKPAGMVGMSSVVIFTYMIYLPTAVPHLCVCVCVCVLSRFSHVWLLVTPWTVAHQAALSMGFSKQEYWSGLPCPPSGCPISNSTLTAESREELKSLLMKMKEESEKTGLKFNIQKTKILASGPITSWHTEGGKWKQWQIFLSWAPKLLRTGTAAMKLKDTCSLKGKLWHLDSILKNKDVTLLITVRIVKAMVFPAVMYRCESWTIKKAEHWRIDAFKLWCWRRLLRVPWTARSSKQSILKEINHKYSLEGLMLKLQYFGHLMRRAASLENPLC